MKARIPSFLFVGFFLSFCLSIVMLFIPESHPGIIFTIALVFLGVFLIFPNETGKKLTDELKNSFEGTLNKNNFKADDSYFNDDYLSGIAINESESKLAILTRNNKNDNFDFKTINFNDIVESSLTEDGVSVSKASISSQIGRTMVGIIVAGGMGAVIGGLSTNKTINNKIYKVTLNVIVNDLSNPICEFSFLNSKYSIDKHGEEYKKVNQESNKWYKMIEIIIKRNEVNSKVN